MLICNNTRYWGNILYYFEEIHSTHTRVHRMASKNRPTEGTVILADFQYQGIGQRGRVWDSNKAQNLLFSSILYPPLSKIHHVFMMNVISSLAICDTLESFLSNTSIKVKWPNDVFASGKKISGILVQTAYKGQSELDYLVLSIGLNVNQLVWKQELNASSMMEISSRAFNRQEILNVLCLSLERRYEQLKSEDISTLMDSYNSRLFNKNEFIELHLDGIWVKEKLLSVNPDGSLNTSSFTDHKEKKHLISQLDLVRFNFANLENN